MHIQKFSPIWQLEYLKTHYKKKKIYKKKIPCWGHSGCFSWRRHCSSFFSVFFFVYYFSSFFRPIMTDKIQISKGTSLAAHLVEGTLGVFPDGGIARLFFSFFFFVFLFCFFFCLFFHLFFQPIMTGSKNKIQISKGTKFGCSPCWGHSGCFSWRRHCSSFFFHLFFPLFFRFFFFVYYFSSFFFNPLWMIKYRYPQGPSLAAHLVEGTLGVFPDGGIARLFFLSFFRLFFFVYYFSSFFFDPLWLIKYRYPKWPSLAAHLVEGTLGVFPDGARHFFCLFFHFFVSFFFHFFFRLFFPVFFFNPLWLIKYRYPQGPSLAAHLVEGTLGVFPDGGIARLFELGNVVSGPQQVANCHIGGLAHTIPPGPEGQNQIILTLLGLVRPLQKKLGERYLTLCGPTGRIRPVLPKFQL